MSSQDCALTSRTGQFRCELGAMPFIGDIKQARIFLLMINPGVSCGDYIDLGNERTSRLFEENKRQERATCFALEPNAAQGWSPYYLSKVFGGVLSRYRAAQREQVRAYLSQHVAIVELVPYFSQNISLVDQLRIDQELPTARLARSAVQELASDPQKLMIPRWKSGKKRWGLSDASNVCPSVCRQGLSQDAKKAICKQINLKCQGNEG